MAFEFIQRDLAKRRAQSLFRSRTIIESSAGAMIEAGGQHFLNFSGNDYLGQRQDLQVMQAWVEGISVYGVGSGASPLVTGHTRAHQQLEDYLAEGLGREKVMLFSSGFAANQAVCQALSHANSALVCDKLMHASFIDAAMHSEGEFKRFKHNDLDHLEHILKGIHGDCIIASEGVFSMDGDNADCEEIGQIANNNNAWFMLDDAHGMGVRGQTGLGTAQALKLSQQQLPILMGTFGKALGTAGAFVAASTDTIDYLINFAKHYIYSTSMPPAMASATLASFHSLQDGAKQQQLNERIHLFRSLCAQADIELMQSNSAIQPVLVGDPTSAVFLSDTLKSMGVWVTAIRYPTVPKAKDRLRITLSTSHRLTDIEALVDALAIAFNRLDERPERVK